MKLLPLLVAALLAAPALAGPATNRVHDAARAADRERPADEKPRRVHRVMLTNDAPEFALSTMGGGWVTTTSEGYIWHPKEGGNPVWITRTREGAIVNPLIGPPTVITKTREGFIVSPTPDR